MIGYLSARSSESDVAMLAAFRRGLAGTRAPRAWRRQQRRDMEIEVLPVVDQGGALHAGSFPAREPQPAGLRDGDGSPRAGAKSRRDRTSYTPRGDDFCPDNCPG